MSLLSKIKNNEKIVSCFATVAMALVTGLMAFFTYNLAKETKNLSEIELRPYVSPKDVGLEFVDKGGTSVKIQTQLGKEDDYKGSLKIENLSGITMAVKFNNSGKLKGILRINKISANNDIKNKDYPEMAGEEIIISGSSDSGWEFGIPLDIEFAFGKLTYFDYELTNHSEDIIFKQPIKFTVFCDFGLVKYENSPPSIGTSCKIKPFGYRYNK